MTTATPIRGDAGTSPQTPRNLLRPKFHDFALPRERHRRALTASRRLPCATAL
jgi:hypothetical protein